MQSPAKPHCDVLSSAAPNLSTLIKNILALLGTKTGQLVSPAMIFTRLRDMSPDDLCKLAELNTHAAEWFSCVASHKSGGCSATSSPDLHKSGGCSATSSPDLHKKKKAGPDKWGVDGDALLAQLMGTRSRGPSTS